MVDASYTEVAGLGAGFNLFISKDGGPFAPSTGVKAEIGDGWYSYESTAAEADTVGPVAIYVTGLNCIQQNLEYVIQLRVDTAITFTYNVTDSITGLPLDDVEVWNTTDIAGINVIANGFTDVFGNFTSYLDVGTYYFWRSKSGYTFVDPDVEVVV